MYCKKCGAKLPELGKFCTCCGSPREASGAAQPPVQQSVKQSAQQPVRKPQRKPARSSKKLTIVLIVLAVLLLAVAGCVVYVILGGDAQSSPDAEGGSIQRADREKPSVSEAASQETTQSQPIEPQPTDPETEAPTQTTQEETQPEPTETTAYYDLSDPYSFTGEYYCPDSDWRYYTEDDVAWMNHDRDYLQMAINEIYARHGFNFQTPEIRAYFESKSWYVCTCEPGGFDTSVLSACEMENIMLFEELKAPK